jgi:hypothetical protein
MTMSTKWRGLALVTGVGWLMGASPGDVGSAPVTGRVLPFHSEVTWQVEQVPVPEGRCTEPLPDGLAYLWLSRIPGVAHTTHLGTGSYYVELCVYGILTNPDAPPPANGIPMGWYADVQIWTAANGDELKATGRMIGFTSAPGTPGFKFIESLTFLDGGTGRFAFAEGTGTGLVDPVAQTAVYDGWIRYGRNEK